MEKVRIYVKARWDDDAEVWVATSEQVPGLVVEASKAEELEKILVVMIPELLKLNGLIEEDSCKDGIPFHLLQESVVIAQAC